MGRDHGRDSLNVEDRPGIGRGLLSPNFIHLTDQPMAYKVGGSVMQIQGWPKRWTPGSVNMWRGNCVILPAAGRRSKLFPLKFTEPGVHFLGHPCKRQNAVE